MIAQNCIVSVIFLFFVIRSVSAQMSQHILNNPNTGIVSYDFKIKNKVTNSENTGFSTNSNYIYLSDILRDNCFTSNGQLDKG